MVFYQLVTCNERVSLDILGLVAPLVRFSASALLCLISPH